jgi:hypothetical protein
VRETSEAGPGRMHGSADAYAEIDVTKYYWRSCKRQSKMRAVGCFVPGALHALVLTWEASVSQFVHSLPFPYYITFLKWTKGCAIVLLVTCSREATLWKSTADVRRQSSC